MCHKIIIYLVSWLMFFGYLPRVNAQQLPQELPQLSYHFLKMAQAEGLSSYYVKKIIQDRYGYTWIATQDGLNRFDGKNITFYSKSADPVRRLVSNDIWDLAEDTLHRCLWVLCYTGLNRIDLASGQVQPDSSFMASAARLFPKGWFKCLRLCGRRLWVGTHNGMAVYDIDARVFDPVDSIPGIEPKMSTDANVDQLLQDEYDRIWVFVANFGIVIYSASTGRILQSHPLAELGMRPDQDFSRFRAVTRLGRGRLALATNAGLLEVRYDRFGFRLSPFPFAPTAFSRQQQETFSCATDPQGRLWLAVQNALFRIDPESGQITQVRDADYVNPENWFSAIYCIYFDRYNHLWLGTQKGLAFSTTSSSPFAAYFQSADYSVTINHANYAFPEQDSAIDVCAEDGLYHVNSVTHTIRRLARGQFIYETRLKDGHLLVSGASQNYVLLGDRLINIETLYPELNSIRGEPIVGLVWCGDSLAILGSESSHGVFCWYPRRHVLTFINEHSRPLKLPSDIVNAVYHDHRGRVWVLSDGLCSIYDPASKAIDTLRIEDPVTHRPANFFFDMTEAQGLYWFALYGTGLIALDDSLRFRRLFSTRDGLANQGIYKVFPWKDSLLFVTSNNGLCRIRLADSTVVNYFQKDGLHGNGFEENAGFFDGRYIYAGGERGVSRIEPGLIPADPAPPELRMGNVRLQTPKAVYDLGDLSSRSLTIPSDVVRATLTLFTFNYTDDGRILLYYSIPELKTQWIPLGADRSIDLLGLSPGRYTLEVRASNPNGPSVDRHLKLAIDWLPKWYQTLWFKLVVLVLAVSLFYVFYRYRISQIRQQQLIRQNMSSDLHDDIGSILNSIKIFVHLARQGPQADTWLNQIETSLAQAVVAVRDMIWVLDDSQDTYYGLLERIRQFAIPITSANGIQLEVVAEGVVSQSLHKDEKRNLLLITKESINNSVKYAHCGRISVRIGVAGKSFTLRIEDNGAGFDPYRVNYGNGIRNIQRRARKIGYIATIDSSPGAGTRIVLAHE
jgi:ligand-binding sensor domain-containing protein